MKPQSIRAYGDQGLLVEVDGPAAVHRLRAAVLTAGIASEAVPGWCTLLVRADGGHAGAAVLREQLLRLDVPAAEPAMLGKPVVVDVVYDGPDLHEVARLVGRPVRDVVALHAAPVYTVALLGFSRGFPYLAGLDPALSGVPRLGTPRARVPAGSVGLAGDQTGVYPMDTPGGWRLLGHTDAVLFDPDRWPPSPLEPGGRLRFRAVG